MLFKQQWVDLAMHCKFILAHDKQNISKVIQDIYPPAEATAKRLELNLKDLFQERVDYLSRYCAEERLYFVLFTRPFNLPEDQLKVG